MELITILNLNRCHHFQGFVYQHVGAALRVFKPETLPSETS